MPNAAVPWKYHSNVVSNVSNTVYPGCFVDVVRPNRVVHSYGVIPHQSFVPYNDWSLAHPQILVALKPHILSPPLIFFGSPGVPMFTALEDVVVQPGDPSFDIAAGQFTVGKPKAAPKSPEEWKNKTLVGCFGYIGDDVTTASVKIIS